MAYTIGIDYGTNSVRALVARVSDGAELGTCIFSYPSGKEGILLDPADHNLARQNPGEYLAGLEAAVKGALAEASATPGFSADQVVGIGVDGTGSSPIPVDAANRPLGVFGEASRRIDLHGIGDVDEMMRNASPFRARQLIGTDIESTIDGRRIAVDDLAIERFRKEQPEGTFSGGGGAENREDLFRQASETRTQ